MFRWTPHAVKPLHWLGSFNREVQIKVKGQGQAGGQKGSKLISQKTHQWAGLSHSAQRTRQSQSLLTMRQSLQAPGIQLAIPLQHLYPQPEPDKSLFTWQSAVADPAREKKKGPFQLSMGSKSSANKRLWSHGSNLKLKGEMGALDSLL